MDLYLDLSQGNGDAMRVLAERSLQGVKGRRTWLLPCLLVANFAALGTLGFVGYQARELSLQLADREAEASALRNLTLAAKSDSLSVQRSAQEQLKRWKEETSQKLQGLEATLTDVRNKDQSATIASSEKLVSELAKYEASQHSEVVASLQSLRENLSALDQRLSTQVETVSNRRVPDLEERFRAIQQEADPSIFLIHCEFVYRTRTDGDTPTEQTGTGWGTGFVLTPEGHIVTNKHVVQPWKFDPELAAMEAIGQIEVLPSTVKISAWPAGTQCMDGKRNLLIENAFNNTTRANLHLVATAPDHMSRKPLEVTGSGVDYPIHELDNNDLVILKADGGTFRPLRCAPRSTKGPEKLQPVMALGFPRGHKGLEKGIAETSPSMGTVRKVEDTIHITAPIIPGNSGGPLFNDKGEVVGVATRIYSETLGICLKIEHVQDLLETIYRPTIAATPATSAPVNATSAALIAERR